jgi:plasmid stabilization system protein ParE
VTVRLSSAAESEIAVSARFYLEESIFAAADFLEEIDEAVRLIGEQPTLYPFHESDIRVKHLDRFPFSLFFKIKVDEVFVLSVAHNSRRPDYWLSRD